MELKFGPSSMGLITVDPMPPSNYLWRTKIVGPYRDDCMVEHTHTHRDVRLDPLVEIYDYGDIQWYKEWEPYNGPHPIKNCTVG